MENGYITFNRLWYSNIYLVFVPDYWHCAPKTPDTSCDGVCSVSHKLSPLSLLGLMLMRWPRMGPPEPQAETGHQRKTKSLEGLELSAPRPQLGKDGGQAGTVLDEFPGWWRRTHPWLGGWCIPNSRGTGAPGLGTLPARAPCIFPSGGSLVAFAMNQHSSK